jgi:hypothetical protein
LTLDTPSQVPHIHTAEEEIQVDAKTINEGEYDRTCS